MPKVKKGKEVRSENTETRPSTFNQASEESGGEISTEESDNEETNSSKQSSKKTPKHDSGLADLQKVTDNQPIINDEGEELNTNLSQAMSKLLIDSKSIDKSSTAKIVIRKEDVELIMNEMEVGKIIAERELRKHRGNVKETLIAMLRV